MEKLPSKIEVDMSPARPVDILDIDTDEAQRKLHAIKQFQVIVQKELKQGHDFGTIPGTQKPTLFKPGAEKIAKLLNLSDQYVVEKEVENWEKPFFHYQIKCKLISLISNQTVSEGLGACNSMESRYRWRWVFSSELTPFLQDRKETLVSKSGMSKAGKPYKMYKIENDELWTLNNTILKIAKKRALVDASLSAGRLSDVFTQDLEDIAEEVKNGNTTAQTESGEQEVKQESQQQISNQPGIKYEQTELIMKLMNTLISEFGKKTEWLISDIQKKIQEEYDVLVVKIPDQLTEPQAIRTISYLKNKLSYLEKKRDEAENTPETEDVNSS